MNKRKLLVLDPTFKNIKKVVFVSLLFFSLIAITFTGYLEFLIDKKSKDTERVRLIAIQSALNQRISDSLNLNSKITPEIVNDVEIMTRMHFQLLNGDESLGLAKIEDYGLISILKSISPNQQQIYNLVNRKEVDVLNENLINEYNKNQEAYQKGLNKIIATQISNSSLPFLGLRRLIFFWEYYL